MGTDVGFQGTLTVHPALDVATVESLSIGTYAQVTDGGESIVVDCDVHEGSFTGWLDVLLEELKAANRHVRGMIDAGYPGYTGWVVVRDADFTTMFTEPTVTRRPPLKRRANPARRRRPRI